MADHVWAKPRAGGRVRQMHRIGAPVLSPDGGFIPLNQYYQLLIQCGDLIVTDPPPPDAPPPAPAPEVEKDPSPITIMAEVPKPPQRPAPPPRRR